ncbi:MAG: zinc-binding dehydrogenase [Thermoprotei archaeon]
MKAIIIRRHGGPEVLELGNVEDPVPNRGEALVSILYTSVNRIDTLVRNGYPGVFIKFPHILGSDVVGCVEKIGDDVTNVSVGDIVIVNPVIGCGYCRACLRGLENMCPKWRMIGFQVDGSYAEYIKVPARSLIRVESNLDLEKLGTVPLALLTSWRSLVTLGSIKRDDVVFIWGGSGGVGTFSIQIAKFFGARVITVTGKGWKIQKIKALGADLVLNYNSNDLVNKVKEFTNYDGVDIVIDSIGSTLSRSLDLDIVKVGGKIITFGVRDSDLLPINWRKIYLKHIEIIGTHTGNIWELMDALQLIKKGYIQPIVHKTFNLEEIAEAHRLLENGEVFGKIAIKVD